MNTKGKRKDHENARADLEEMGIRLELYVEEAENGKVLPVAATTMSKKEKKELCKFLRSVKFSSEYGSNFARLVNMRNHFKLSCICKSMPVHYPMLPGSVFIIFSRIACI